MQQLKNNKKQSIATHFSCTAYIPGHFEVPATGNGFFVLVRMVDKIFTTFKIEETNRSFSDTSRHYNSTKDESLLTGQPWTRAFSIWRFNNDSQRLQCKYDLTRLSNMSTKNFSKLAEGTRKHVNTFYPHSHIRITGQVINIDPIN